MITARTIARETISFDEESIPQLLPGTVLVQVHAVSLCGTDLHIYEDDFPTDLPIVQGHELSGRVLEADPASGFAAGDRVVVDPLIACRQCRVCQSGRHNVCPHLSVLGCYTDGGFTEVLGP